MAENVPLASSIVASVVGGGSGDVPETVRRAATAYLTIRGFMSPRMQSRAGLMMTSEQLRAFLQQFPRIATEVIRQAAIQEPEETPQPERR